MSRHPLVCEKIFTSVEETEDESVHHLLNPFSAKPIFGREGGGGGGGGLGNFIAAKFVMLERKKK